jgi:hypothetical protein
MTSLSFFQKTAFSVHLARDTPPWENASAGIHKAHTNASIV